MIYQDTKRFLKRHLKRPSKSYEWHGRDNILLLEYLQDRYPDKNLKPNCPEMKVAFKEFFETVGNIDFEFDIGSGAHYKIEPYTVSPKKSKHLLNIIKIIRSNRRSIEYPYQGREDQIALLGKIRRHINAEITESDESVNKKELVRYAIKEALELNPRDVVIHLKRKYIVKIFHTNKFLQEQVKEPTAPDTSERRYMGFSSADLENHYEEFFKDINLEDFIGSVMDQLFITKLNFEEITNIYYEKNILNLVRNTISLELMMHISQNDEYLKGFAGYIFRKNFEKVHEFIAIELFEKIAKKDSNAQKFLNYYTGSIYIEDGIRYEMPSLVTTKGERWNITSITSISTLWLHSRSQKNRLEVKLQNLLEEFYELEQYYNRLSKQSAQNSSEYTALLKKYKKIEESMHETKLTFKREISGSMDDKKENELETYLRSDRHKLIEVKKAILKLQPTKDNAVYELKGVEFQYTSLKEEKQHLEQSVRTLNQNLKIGSDSFHSILHSLVKALMERKRVVE